MSHRTSGSLLLHRALGALLSSAMILSSAFCSFAQVKECIPTEVDESYYALLDPYGKFTDGSMVKTFHLHGASEITDYGSYRTVSNLTDSREAETSGDRVRFQFGDHVPEHFYFEGKTRAPFETLPFLISLSYSLNGVPTEAMALAGKTGVVEIKVKAVPNPSSSSYMKNNWFLSAAAAFNQNELLSLEAADAQIQTLGNIRTAIFFWLPGETREYTLRIGTDDFRFNGLHFMMGPINASGRLQDISDLRSAKEDSERSREALKDAADEILDSMDLVKTHLNNAAAGLQGLNDVRASVNRDNPAFYAGLDSMSDDLSTLSSCLAPISGHLCAADNRIADMRNGLIGLNDVLLSLQSHLSATQDTLRSLNADMQSIQDNGADLNRNLRDVKTDVDRLNALGKGGKKTVEEHINGSLSRMEKLYRAYVSYRKAQGLSPFDAISDGSVLYDLDAKGQEKASPGNAGTELSYRGNGTVTLKALSYPEGSFQHFATEQLEDMGYRNDEIAYVLTLWENRGKVGTVSENAGKLYDGALRLSEDIGRIDALQLTDLAMNFGMDGESLTSDLSAMTRDFTDSIRQIDSLHKTTDSMLSELHPALNDATKLSDSVQDSTASLSYLFDVTKKILEKNSAAFHRSAGKTLQHTAELLGQSADTLESTEKLRTAKRELSDLIDRKWEEHTGEKSNIFLLDPQAPPVSLTSEKNEHVRSVSVLLRTEEIKTPEMETHLHSADDRDHRSVFARIAQMFSDLRNFLFGWMQK